MNEWPRALLLDTHVAIWTAEGSLADEIVEKLVYAGLADGVFVSPITAWEVGLLARPRPDGRAVPQFLPDPVSWFAQLIAKPIIKLAPLTPSMAISSSFLPGELHADPADRLLVATAREMNLTLMTRDHKLQVYGTQGHVRIESC